MARNSDLTLPFPFFSRMCSEGFSFDIGSVRPERCSRDVSFVGKLLDGRLKCPTRVKYCAEVTCSSVKLEFLRRCSVL